MLAARLLGFGLLTLRSRRGAARVAMITTKPEIPRSSGLPPLALLGRPEWSIGRKVAMLTLRGYLVISVILLSSRRCSSVADSTH